MSDQEIIRDLTARLYGAEAALRLQKIWTIEWENKYWREVYGHASRMIDDSQRRQEDAERKSRGGA